MVLGIVLVVFSVLALNQAGLIKLLSTSSSSGGPSSTASGPLAWCGSALAAVPISNIGPNGNPNFPGCYSQTFTTFKIATVDAVSGLATNALFVRILSGGGTLNTAAFGTPLEGAQESGNTYTATAGPYTSGQALIVEVCSGSNGAAQATTCTSDFTAGNTVTYYSIQGGPNGAGAGFVPFATSLSTVSLTVTQPVYIVQNQYKVVGTFGINGTSFATGAGSGGSTGAARSAKTNSATPTTSNMIFTLSVLNTYSTTTFPYEAGFVSSSEADVNSRALNMALQCVLAKTGGVAGDVPVISGMPQIATSGGGVANGGSTYYSIVEPDTSTQVIGQNKYQPLSQTGQFNVPLTINQGALVSGDTFTLTCQTYMWYNLSLVQQANGAFALNGEAVTMTATFTLTLTF